MFVTGVSTHEGYTFERDVTIRFGEEAIAGRTSRATGTRGGQRLCSSLAIETSLTPSAVFALAPRQTGGFAGSLLRLPGLDHAPVPDHGTLSRRARERDARVESAREFGRRAWKKQVSYHQQARVESSFYRYRQLLLPVQAAHRRPARKPKQRSTRQRARTRDQGAEPGARSWGVAIGADLQRTVHRVRALCPERSCNDALAGRNPGAPRDSFPDVFSSNAAALPAIAIVHVLAVRATRRSPATREHRTAEAPAYTERHDRATSDMITPVDATPSSSAVAHRKEVKSWGSEETAHQSSGGPRSWSPRDGVASFHGVAHESKLPRS